MSNFTQGPWVADKTSRAIGPVSRESDQSYGMVIPVAWVEFDPEVEIQAANHQLIAAAPELLDLVQRANGKNGCHTVAWQEKAKEVLAKALGQ